MDKCYYCGFEYHPMPVYTRSRESTLGKPPRGDKPLRIWVCHLRFTNEKGEIDVSQMFECREKAAADGYEFREDLTPRR